VVTERVDEGDVGKAGGKVLLKDGGGGLKVREKGFEGEKNVRQGEGRGEKTQGEKGRGKVGVRRR